jgi:hypothetical protein
VTYTYALSNEQSEAPTNPKVERLPSLDVKITAQHVAPISIRAVADALAGPASSSLLSYAAEVIALAWDSWLIFRYEKYQHGVFIGAKLDGRTAAFQADSLGDVRSNFVAHTNFALANLWGSGRFATFFSNSWRSASGNQA